MKIITPTSVLLLLAVTLGVTGASAQDNSLKKKSEQAPGSSSAASKSRARRVVANSSGEPASATTDQSTVPKTVEPSNESSVKPTVTAAKAGEEPAETTGSKTTEKPSDKSTEKPGDAKPLPPPVADAKGTDASLDSLISLREQIDAAPRGPERIRLQLKLAAQLVAVDKKAEAITELHAITNADVFDPQGLYNAGNALARLRDSEGAINAYRKAIDQKKGNYSRALNNLGVVLFREGRWDEAHDALLSALRLESFHYAEASYNLGRLYSARGESDLAIREWHRALAIDPEHTEAARALAGSEGAMVVRTGKSARGASVNKNSNSVAERSSGSPAVSGRTGKSPATRSLETSKVLYTDSVTYDFLQRARNFSDRGKLEEAVEDYKRVIARSRGYFPPANVELGCVLLNLKRHDEALANFLQVAERDGALFPISYYHLARLYELKGDLILAEQSFARAAAAYKTRNDSVLLDLSRVRERRGDFKGALAAMEEYVAAMEQQGLRLAWADERLSVLRRKAAGAQVQPK